MGKTTDDTAEITKDAPPMSAPGVPVTASAEPEGHAADCATHNAPAMPTGACDCGGDNCKCKAAPGGFKKVFETGCLVGWTEKDGTRKIGSVESPDKADIMHVQLISDSEYGEHAALDTLFGKRVRVTVEVLG